MGESLGGGFLNFMSAQTIEVKGTDTTGSHGSAKYHYDQIFNTDSQ
jgi:hypothetical protein